MKTTATPVTFSITSKQLEELFDAGTEYGRQVYSPGRPKITAPNKEAYLKPIKHMPTESIIKDIVSSNGTSDSSEVYMIADIKSGETELVISKTVTERYPITDYDKVMNLHERLNRSGRRSWKLEDFTK